MVSSLYLITSSVCFTVGLVCVTIYLRSNSASKNASPRLFSTALHINTNLGISRCSLISCMVTSVRLRIAGLSSAHVFNISIILSGHFCASGIAINLDWFISSILYHSAVSDSCSITVVLIGVPSSKLNTAFIITVFPVPL